MDSVVVPRLGKVEARFGVLFVARIALPRLALARIAKPRCRRYGWMQGTSVRRFPVSI